VPAENFAGASIRGQFAEAFRPLIDDGSPGCIKPEGDGTSVSTSTLR